MSAQYPNAVKSFTSRNAGDVIQPSHINDLQDEVNAIEAGLLNGTANLQSSNSTILNLIVTRNSTLGSSITIGTIPYIFPAAGGSTGQVLAISSTSGSTCTLSWQAPPGQLTLLKAGTGTDTSAGATTVDSVVLPALTALDLLIIEFSIESVTQTTTTPGLYHATDPRDLVFFNGGNVTAGVGNAGRVVLQQRQGTPTSQVVNSQGVTMASVAFVNSFFLATTAAWTSGWTLGLRHGGVVAGGTFKWRWSVYKLAGQ